MVNHENNSRQNTGESLPEDLFIDDATGPHNRISLSLVGNNPDNQIKLDGRLAGGSDNSISLPIPWLLFGDKHYYGIHSPKWDIEAVAYISSAQGTTSAKDNHLAIAISFMLRSAPEESLVPGDEVYFHLMGETPLKGQVVSYSEALLEIVYQYPHIQRDILTVIESENSALPRSARIQRAFINHREDQAHASLIIMLEDPEPSAITLRGLSMKLPDVAIQSIPPPDEPEAANAENPCSEAGAPLASQPIDTVETISTNPEKPADADEPVAMRFYDSPVVMPPSDFPPPMPVAPPMTAGKRNAIIGIFATVIGVAVMLLVLPLLTRAGKTKPLAEFVPAAPTASSTSAVSYNYLPLDPEYLAAYFRQNDPACFMGKLKLDKYDLRVGLECENAVPFLEDRGCSDLVAGKCRVKRPTFITPGTTKLIPAWSYAIYGEPDPSCVREPLLPFDRVDPEQKNAIQLTDCADISYDPVRACYDYSSCSITHPNF